MDSPAYSAWLAPALYASTRCLVLILFYIEQSTLLTLHLHMHTDLHTRTQRHECLAACTCCTSTRAHGILAFKLLAIQLSYMQRPGVLWD